MLALQSGVWRNNVLFAGPVALAIGSRQAAFEERAANADPAAVQNNLFHVFLGPPLPPLYINEVTTTISTAMGINALMDMFTGGNLAGDPLFINPALGNYNLAVGSPASRTGMLMGAPTVDLIGAFRPNPVGTNPDIGRYEANYQ